MTDTSSSVGGEELIQSFRFSTDSFRAKDQFEAWRNFIGPLTDLKSIGPEDGGFQAKAEAYSLGALQLSRFHISPVIFNHTSEYRRTSGVDHWALSTLRQGKAIFAANGDELKSKPGSLSLQSYARPFSGAMEEMECTSLFLDRDSFWDISEELDGSSQNELKGPMSQILREFIISVEKQAPRLTNMDVSAINTAFSHLLRATFRQNADTLDAAKAPIAASQFSMARRFISANLKAPNLSADMICAHLGMSRRRLYYLFKNQGGVKRYITNRRLAACYSVLTDGTEQKLISSIAYEYGFTNLSSFYRQFYARYGFRPSEARLAWFDGHRPRKIPTETFADWILRGSES